jgi:hypothetical protein
MTITSSKYLTATDKKHIAALLKSGKTQAKINRAIWAIDKGDLEGNYTLSKYVNDRGLGWIGSELRQSRYTFDIKVKQ